MTVTVANTDLTDTFEYWRNRTNELADAMSTVVVTTNSNTSTGNAVVNGYVISSSLISNTISGGNSSVSNVLFFTSNTQHDENSIITVGNTTVNTQISPGSINNITSLSPPSSSIFTIQATSAIKIPVGLSSERPTGASGMFRYNSSLNKYEIYLGGGWQNVAVESTQLRIYNVSNNQIFP